MEALASKLHSDSAGMLDTQVVGLRGLDIAGNEFPITGISIDLAPKTPVLPAPCERVTKTGNGLRLASFEGNTL